MPAKPVKELTKCITEVISETNGITIMDTLELASTSEYALGNPTVRKSIQEFLRLLGGFQQDEVDIQTLLNHPVSEALRNFFKKFPLSYKEEHIHLTGSLTAEFVYPRLKALLQGPHKEMYWKKIQAVYGDVKIESVEDVDELLRL